MIFYKTEVQVPMKNLWIQISHSSNLLYFTNFRDKKFKIPAEKINNYFINLYNISGW